MHIASIKPTIGMNVQYTFMIIIVIMKKVILQIEGLWTGFITRLYSDKVLTQLRCFLLSAMYAIALL